MKLQKLNVKGYKNLDDITFDFTKSSNSILVVGTNGSGKSNLLEVLSAIFYALYNKEKDVNPHFDFTLEYVIERMRTESAGGGPLYEFPIDVSISNESGEIKLLCKPSAHKEWGTISDAERYSVFPEHVVAIYSGEEKRLWEDYYFDFYESFNKQYMANKPYQPQKMFYINKYYWDLIASILAIYEDDSVKLFLSDIGLNISSISCKFDVAKIKTNLNAMAKEILSVINPESKDEVELTLEQLSGLQYICGYEKDVFYNLIVLVLYKQFKIITDFKVSCDDGRTIRELSEGEKKLLLIYGAMQIIDGENLYLLDEPDAHIHEGRKKDIYELIKYGSMENAFIITSHSPTMTNLFDINDLFVLNKQEDKIESLKEDKKLAISQLTNGEWTYIDQTIFFDNKKPLIITEGKSDIDLIKQAIKEFSKQPGLEKYGKLDFEFLSAGGTGNIPDFYNKVREINMDKQIIILCDNDDAGNKTIAKINSKAVNKIKRDKYYKTDKLVITKLPNIDGVSGNFIIEDYLPKTILDDMAKGYLEKDTYKSFSSFPKVKFDLKADIAEKAKSFTYEQLKNMKVLLNLLYEIGQEVGYISN